MLFLIGGEDTGLSTDDEGAEGCPRLLLRGHDEKNEVFEAPADERVADQKMPTGLPGRSSAGRSPPVPCVGAPWLGLLFGDEVDVPAGVEETGAQGAVDCSVAEEPARVEFGDGL